MCQGEIFFYKALTRSNITKSKRNPLDYKFKNVSKFIWVWKDELQLNYVFKYIFYVLILFK